MNKILAILITGILLLSGCAVTPTPTSTPEGKGTLEVRVTDAPRSDNVTAILVTASRLEVHRAGVGSPPASDNQTSTDNQTATDNTTSSDNQTAEPVGGQWLTLPLSLSSFDLLKIKGIEELFATSEVAAGKYTQVRLTVDKVEVSLSGGAPRVATLPSGVLKFNHPFEVVDGQKTVLVMDFDAEKSVNVTGNDTIMVRPVVSLTVKQGSSSPTSTPTSSANVTAPDKGRPANDDSRGGKEPKGQDKRD